MKNLLIILGLIGPATAALAQSKPRITQEGTNNVVKVGIEAQKNDTITGTNRIITQSGSNQILIESSVSSDSLGKALENVTVQQQGKGNTVSVQSTGNKSNNVSITQSGSGNSISIKQN